MSLIPWKNKQTDSDTSSHDLAPTLTKFRCEMDRMFDRFFHEPFGALAEGLPEMRAWGPVVDLAETDTHVIVKAEVPGVDPEDVDVSITGDVLTISGQKDESTEREGKSFYHAERRFGSFQRNVQLPTYVDAERVSAEHVNGVLTIQLAKSESAKPKRVPVKAL